MFLPNGAVLPTVGVVYNRIAAICLVLVNKKSAYSETQGYLYWLLKDHFASGSLRTASWNHVLEPHF